MSKLIRKFLAASDFHLHNFKAFSVNNSRLEWQLKVLDILFAVAHKHGIKEILFPGDLFHQQKAIPTIVINWVVKRFKKLFKQYPEISFISISGNHDHATQNILESPAETAQEFLEEVFDGRFFLLDNGVYRVNAENDCLIYGIPYYEYPEDFKKKLEAIEISSNYKGVKLLMMHQTPAEIRDASRMQIDTSIHDEGYEKFDLVLNGHIHLTEELSDKFINVGAPTQQSRGEENYDCGFYLIEVYENEKPLVEFKSLNSRFPEFIDIEEGGSRAGLKEIDYVTEMPVLTPIDESDDAEIVEKFRSDLRSSELIENYVEELPERDLEKSDITDRKKLLKVGISLIN